MVQSAVYVNQIGDGYQGFDVCGVTSPLSQVQLNTVALSDRLLQELMYVFFAGYKRNGLFPRVSGVQIHQPVRWEE
jgi:hypothetical protein